MYIHPLKNWRGQFFGGSNTPYIIAILDYVKCLKINTLKYQNYITGYYNIHLFLLLLRQEHSLEL